MAETTTAERGVLTVKKKSGSHAFLTPLDDAERQQLDALVGGAFAFDGDTHKQVGTETVGVTPETRTIEVVDPLAGG